MMRRIAVVLALAVGCAALQGARPPAASACTCVSSTEQEHFDRAAVVFAGRASAVDETDVGYSAAFVVEAVLKGEAGTNIRVATNRDSAGCGFRFTAGDRYEVFAVGGAGALTTSICSGTRRVSRPSDVYRPPGVTARPPLEASPPVAEPPPDPADDRPSASTWPLVSALAAAGVVLAALLRRRRR